MEKLTIEQMEGIDGGACVHKAAGLMTAGMIMAFTPAGAALIIGGALYGYFAC